MNQHLLNWGKEFTIEFDLVIKSLNTHFTGEWQNIFHLTIGPNYGTFGTRIPALFLNKNGYLRFRSQLGDQSNYWFTFYIELNKNYSVKIAQQQIEGKHIFSITINGHVVNSVQNLKPMSFQKVLVYLSDPFFETFGPSGTLSNLKIQGS